MLQKCKTFCKEIEVTKRQLFSTTTIEAAWWFAYSYLLNWTSKCDHIKRLITLTIDYISGFHCTVKNTWWYWSQMLRSNNNNSEMNSLTGTFGGHPQYSSLVVTSTNNLARPYQVQPIFSYLDLNIMPYLTPLMLCKDMTRNKYKSLKSLFYRQVPW